MSRQFYKLSKAYHPDLHPNDPNASHRFVKISEAYATLGSPSKKQKYDHDFLRSQPGSRSSSARPNGSYSSSAATPAGGRPPSGLSKRRTTFRGPPPSFYRSGGWGEHEDKRAEAASSASHSYEAQGRSQSGPGGPAGTGPGGFTSGFDNDVPHFDQRGHFQTHSQIERSRRQSKRRTEREMAADQGGGNSTLFNFLIISGAFAIIFGVSGYVTELLEKSGGRGAKRRNPDG
nr:dnaj-like protein [Quercus suber]